MTAEKPPEQPERSHRKRRRRRKTASGKSGGRTAASSTAGRTPRTVAPASGKDGTAEAAKVTGKRKVKARAKRKKPVAVAAKPQKTGGPIQREVSAGGVVYRRVEDEIEVVLASRRTRRGELAWGLAKGGIEEGESLEDAAVREVREETGLLAAIEGSLGDTKYFYVWENVRIRKIVHFFLMRATGGDVADRDDEMEEVRWFPLERARKRAAYRGEREVIERAADLLR